MCLEGCTPVSCLWTVCWLKLRAFLLLPSFFLCVTVVLCGWLPYCPHIQTYGGLKGIHSVYLLLVCLFVEVHLKKSQPSVLFLSNNLSLFHLLSVAVTVTAVQKKGSGILPAPHVSDFWALGVTCGWTHCSILPSPKRANLVVLKLPGFGLWLYSIGRKKEAGADEMSYLLECICAKQVEPQPVCLCYHDLQVVVSLVVDQEKFWILRGVLKDEFLISSMSLLQMQGRSSILSRNPEYERTSANIMLH